MDLGISSERSTKGRSVRLASSWIVLIGMILYVWSSFCVDLGYSAIWSKLKKCDQVGFCRRNRGLSPVAIPGATFITEAESPRRPPVYQVLPNSIEWREKDPSCVRGLLHSDDLGPQDQDQSVVKGRLAFEISSYHGGIFRFVIDDNPEYRKHARYRVDKGDVIVESAVPRNLSKSEVSVSETTLVITSDTEIALELDLKDFVIVLRNTSSNEILITMNRQKLFNMELQSSRPLIHEEKDMSEASTIKEGQDEEEKPEQEQGQKHEHLEREHEPHVVGSSRQAVNCDGCFEESFDGKQDTKKRGPESTGVDISFVGASQIYGIPERTVSFALPRTKTGALGKNGSDAMEPYRLYNLDVNEYELDKPLSTYGSVPLMTAIRKNGVSGILWLNPSETFIDVVDGADGIDTHWFSESGVMDVILLPGGSQPDSVLSQYLYLTGPPSMPNRFSLGYHQCRWNYRDQADTLAVDSQFDVHNIPYDVIWLDIEHTDGKRYFTWNYEKFPDPTFMQNDIASRGRKMVTIIDPHIKRDSNYKIHTDAEKNNYYVKNADGTSDFDGWCWPGSSSYMDFTNPKVREAWASKFNNVDYPHFTEHLYTWVDMNEPSVFNGPEQTMPKDNVHFGGWEHRDVHNLYGMMLQRATYEGLLKARNNKDRPFVLSRSFFAGSHRYGAIWTGDNDGSWPHLKSTIPMLLSLQISGMIFSGADVGGFFGNPQHAGSLLVRWYQAGAFQPFFRGHAHMDTERREPWLFGEENTRLITKAIRERYAFLPYWYTLFAIANHGLDADASGSKLPRRSPPMRPLWWHFDNDENVWTIETTHMVGDALLVAPILDDGTQDHSVYFPGHGETRWFDLYDDMKEIISPTPFKTFANVLDRMYVFQRGGTIIPRQERRRRSSQAMAQDPYTLYIALDSHQHARGLLYVDDGKSYSYEQSFYSLREFIYTGNKLVAKTLQGTDSGFPGESSLIERIVIMGWKGGVPKSVRVSSSSVPNSMLDAANDIQLINHHGHGHVLIVKKPGVTACKNTWSITFDP